MPKTQASKTDRTEAERQDKLRRAYSIRSKDGRRWSINSYNQKRVRKDCLRVEDLITGQDRLEPLADIEEVGMGVADVYIARQLDAAMKRSDKLKGLKPGKLLSTQVADGRAWYEVTAVHRGWVTIEWRGYSLDRWHDQVLCGGGDFPRDMIARLVR